ncbi:hypothetical protein CA54_18290 [Symmachiella macrocystis]|uniref:Cytochrome c domain-containing protein n=1 Tax=Symmachiella macrocystis TaxID=2527985 RepID=A0A5C6BLE3_9PLAN|nr:PVC-type heme-binding CxxCH protein [Symmachiella macrocystis]TWU13003.1 hypothetical protein CA54_18290 [Symmachiella macrocystis]
MPFWKYQLRGILAALVATVFSGTLFAAEEAPRLRNTEAGSPPSAAETVERIQVPDGFQVTLFAGEPDVQQPIGMTTDERGRLWVAENYTYAEHPLGFDKTQHDRIVILEDTDDDGQFDVRKVFIDDLQKLTSVEVGMGGVWVLCAPQLLFIPDRNHDDVPDGPPEVVLDGWDEGSVRHNIVNGLRWGPDGWLYGRHGILATSFVGPPGASASQRRKLNCCIWRYHPTRKVFEVVADGTTNSWGFDFDEHGEMFFINTVIGHLWHLVPGAHYRRMYGADFNPYVYELIEQCADHFHWDTGEVWHQIRKGVSDTTLAAGGGHAHSGLLIYQGDNWPERYRGTMLTLNFHGRRMNNDRLERDQAGYVGKHADDLFIVDNPWFRGLDLITGPDGGVFIADWSDSGECHDNDGIHRTSGRIYKMTYGQPRPLGDFDLAQQSDLKLVKLQSHENAWSARQSRRLLQERAALGQEMPQARKALLKMFAEDSDVTHQLRAMWCLYAIGATDEEWLRGQLDDDNEHVRVWALRLLADDGTFSAPTIAKMRELAQADPSGLVRLHLASTLQRLPLESRWDIADALAQHAADAQDRALPLMIWYGIEPAIPTDPGRSIALAERSKIGLLRRLIARRLTSDLESQPAAVDQLLQLIGTGNDAEFQLDILQGMNGALRGWRKAPQPKTWPRAAEIVFSSAPEKVQEQARQLGVVFGDGQAISELREIVTDTDADAETRRNALRFLVDDRSPEALALLKHVLGDLVLMNEVLRGFAAFDDPQIPRLILERYARLEPSAREVAIATLASRPASARALLKSIAEGKIQPSAISAFHARQIRSFKDPALNEELTKQWGALRDSSEEKVKRIAELTAALAPEKLQAGHAGKGRVLFEKTCSNCHVLYGAGGRVGPDLTGSNRQNLNYLLENIVDPSASVGQEFQASAIVLNDGRVVTGVVVAQSDRTLEVQTEKERLVIDRSDVEEVVNQKMSLMPDGLLKQLKAEEIRDLFAYLTSRSQVPLPSKP